MKNIDQGKRQSGMFSDLTKKYLSRFKIIQSPRLFDLEGETKLIKQGICPICECQLKVSKKGDVYCNTKKHLSISKKRLFITSKGMSNFK